MANQMKSILSVCLVISVSTIFIDVVDGGACTRIPCCNNCTYDVEAKKATCHQCDPMYGKTKVNGFDRCLSCSLNEGCTKCTDFSKECDLCRFSNHGPDKGKNTCSPCAPYCRSCRKTGSGKCDVCEPGSRKVNDICEKCSVENCRYCDGSTTTCASCVSGYFLEKNTCQQCVANCRACHNAQKCDYPNDHYFVLPDSGQCVECSENCRACKDVDDCTSCNTGFYVDAKKGCSPCDESCLACTAKDTCTYCKKGKVENGSCKCADNCQSCDTAGNGKCDKGKCITGFVESEGKGCKRSCKTSHCKTCSASQKCTECESGYTLDSDAQCLNLN
jgi:hypothetical protein